MPLQVINIFGPYMYWSCAYIALNALLARQMCVFKHILYLYFVQGDKAQKLKMNNTGCLPVNKSSNILPLLVVKLLL